MYSPQYLIGRRQAISMDRLNNLPSATRYLSQIHLQHHHHQTSRASNFPATLLSSSNNNNNNNTKDNQTTLSHNNGSLSSGSNSSIDESASDAEQQQNQVNNNLEGNDNNTAVVGKNSQLIPLTRVGRPAGLSRSASRVSRFRSAKEFFERLSSVNNNNNNNNTSPLHQSPSSCQPSGLPVKFLGSPASCKQSPERLTRGNVALRYIAPLAAVTASATNLSTSITSPQEAPLDRIVTTTPPAATLKMRRPNFTTNKPLPISSQSPSTPSGTLAADQQPAQQQATPPSSVLVIGSSGQRESKPKAEQSETVDTKPTPQKLPPSPTAVSPQRPRSLSLVKAMGSANATVAPPPATPPHHLATPFGAPVPVSSRLSSSSSSSSSSCYVKLKSSDTSGLSTNTILHINNSHLSCNARSNGDNSSKSVINNSQSCEPPLAFSGDNVIVGNGSLLVRRNKQLRITFDESMTATFEYPPEEAVGCESGWDVDTSGDGADSQTAATKELKNGLEEASSEQLQATTTTTTDSKPQVAAVNGLVNYKPNSLMIEANGINMDQQLGVTNLVPISTPKAKTSSANNAIKYRQTMDQWASNNGSVIYAQPVTSQHSSNKYLRGMDEDGNTSLVQMSGQRVCSGNNPNYNTIRSSNGRGAATNKINSHHQNQTKNLHPMTRILSDENLSGEDLNNRTDLATKWSNGSGTTSDLLF